MKKINLIMMAALITIAASFSSCEKLAEELQDSMKATIYTELNAAFLALPDAEKNSMVSTTFSDTAIIDINRNEDLEDYLETIESIEVYKIKVQIDSVSSDNLVLENATFSIIDNTTEEMFEFSTPSNLPLVLNAEYELPESYPGWDKVNEIIGSMHSVTAIATGSINNEDFTVRLNVILYVRVTATP